MTFGLSVDDDYLSMFRVFCYKLLLVMVKEIVEQRSLDSGFLF